MSRNSRLEFAPSPQSVPYLTQCRRILNGNEFKFGLIQPAMSYSFTTRTGCLLHYIIILCPYKTCLRAFERFSGRKTCPMCRRDAYETRVIHEGAKRHKDASATRLVYNPPCRIVVIALTDAP